MRAGDGGSGRERDCSRPSLRLPSRPATERTREPAPGRARGSERRPEERRAGSQRSPSGRVRSLLRAPRDGQRRRSGEGAAVPAWAMGVPRLERGLRRLQVREERSWRGRGDLWGRGSTSPRRVPRGSPCCARWSSASALRAEGRQRSGAAPEGIARFPSGAAIRRIRNARRLGAVLPRWEQLCSGTGLRASKLAVGIVAIVELVCPENGAPGPAAAAPRVEESGGRLFSPCCFLKWISCFLLSYRV